MKNEKTSIMVFISVIIMEILVGAEVDLFVPSFPELQKLFDLTPCQVELTLSVNLVAYCIFSLFAGNLGDKFGRKPVLILSLLVFILGSTFCSFAPTFSILLVGRALQGIGIAGPAVLGYVVIADIYSAEKQQNMMGMINGVISFAMAFAPVVGSYVSLYCGWRGNFVALLALGIVSLIMCFIFIPKGDYNPKATLSLREYSIVLSSKTAMLYIICICLLIIPYWLFISISPILYMGDMKIPLEYFGFYQGAMCVVFSTISFTSSFWQTRYGLKACFNFGIITMVLFVIACLFLVIAKVNDPITITTVMLISSVAFIFPINILYPLALESVENAKGKVSALFVAFRMIGTAVAIEIVSYLHTGTFMVLGTSIVLFTISFLGCLHLLRKRVVLFKAD